MVNALTAKQLPGCKKFVTNLLLMVFLLTAVLAFAGGDKAAIPEKPTSWVTDYAGILSPGEKQQLDHKLAAMETQTSTQLFVAIFESLPEGHYLEDFTTRLFEKWRPGTDNNDNGVLLAVFIGDRKLRIETGYGLEDVLPDAMASRIITNEIVPSFRNGNYFSGISQGTTAIMAAVEGKYQTPIDRITPDGEFPISLIIFIIFIIILMLRSRRSGTTYTGRGVSPHVGRRGPVIFPTSFGGGSMGRGSSGPTFGGGFGGFSGGGGASGSW